jgi:azurin
MGAASGVTAALSACGGAQVAPTVASTGKTFTFDFTSDDTIKFNHKDIEVEAGSSVTINLTNTSTDKRFNWVLAKPGRMLRVITDGQSESETNDYIKPNDENVIVHTKMIGAGEADSITFDAPPPGEYQFFSTFPGYYSRLNGTLFVK